MHYEWIRLPDGTSMHKQIVPEWANPVDAPPTEPVRFTCEICGKQLSTKLALAGHTRGHKWQT